MRAYVPPATRRARRLATNVEPVGVDELKDATLRMIVDRFGRREIDWQTVEAAMKLVTFEVKQTALFAPREAPP